MAITHDLIAKTGEYTNAAGETKARWTKVGVAMSNKQGGVDFPGCWPSQSRATVAC